MHTSRIKAETRAAQQASPPARQPTQQPAPLSPELALHRALGNRSYGQYLQAKLTVNRPGDLYEQEADRVTEQVLRMPEPVIQRACDCDGTCASYQEEETSQRQPTAEPITPLMQRQEALESDEERDAEQVQRQVDDEEEEDVLQTKEKPGPMSETPPGTALRIQAFRGGGQPLTASERSFFEPRFGLDFSRVRVHTGARAAEAAQAVHAQAFTVGRNVVFGAGQYAPGTTHGQRLMAHELTHVVQQAQGRTPSIQRVEVAEGETLTLGSNVLELPARLDARPFPSEQVGDYEFASSIGKDLWWKVQVAWTWVGTNRFTALQLLIEILETLDSLRSVLRRVAPHNTTLDELIEEIKYTLDLVWELEPDDPFLSERFATMAGYLRDLDFQFEEAEEAEHGDEQSGRLHRFLGGLGDGIASFGSGQLAQFGQRLDDVFIHKHPLLSKLYFQGGMIWGVVEQASKILKVIFDLMTPERAAPHEQALWEAIAAFKDLVKEMLGPNAGQAAYEIGYALGAQVPDEIAALNKAESDLDFASKLGQKVGPAFVEAVLSLLGFEAFVAARVVALAENVLDAFVSVKRIKSLLPARVLRHTDLPDAWAPVEVRIGNEAHTLSIVEKGGRRFVRLCSNSCGELAEKIASVLEHFGGGDETRSRLNELRRKLNELSEGEGPDVQQQFEQIEKKFKELAREDPEVAFAVSEVDLEASRRPQVDLDDEFEQEALERFRPRSSDQESQVIWLVARRLVERVREGEGVPHSIYVAGERSRLLSADEHYPHLDWQSGFRYYVVVVYREGGEHIQYSVNYFPDENRVGTIKAERGPPR